MDNRQTLVDLGFEDTIVFDNPSFDAAIIGTTSDHRAVYSYDKMVECLMYEDTEEAYNSAVEFIEYNTLRSLPYIENSPVVVFNMDLF